MGKRIIHPGPWPKRPCSICGKDFEPGAPNQDVCNKKPCRDARYKQWRKESQERKKKETPEQKALRDKLKGK